MSEAAQVTGRFLETGGARLRVATRGEGAPVLVVPGGPGFGCAYLLQPLSEGLAKHHRLIFYDPRGSGASTGHDRPQGLTVERFVEDLDAVRAFSGGSKVDLLGHSFGGLLTLLYALRFSGHVRRIVVVDGDPVRYSDWIRFREIVAGRRTPFEHEQLDALKREPDWERDPEQIEAFFRISLRPYFGRPAQAGLLRFGFSSTSFEQRQQTSKAVRGDLGEWDYREDLRALDHPVLLLYGEETIFPLESAGELAGILPNARLEILPGVGHFPFLEDPARFSAHVLAFLEDDGRA